MKIVYIEIVIVVTVAIAIGVSIAILDWVWIVVNCFLLALWIKSLVDEIKGLNRLIDVMKGCLDNMEDKLDEIVEKTLTDSKGISQKD